MNKLEELEKKYEELGKEIEKLKNEDSFTAGWYVYWDNNTLNTMGYLIGFIRTNKYLNDKLSFWDNVVKIDKDAFDKLLKPKTTIYDWSKIPEWATFAVMNKNSNVFCGDFTGCPIIHEEGVWEGKGAFNKGWQFLGRTFVLNPPDDWRDSFERRPE